MIILVLAGIQVIRLMLYRAIASAGTLSGWFEPYGDITNGLSMLITGLIIWIVFRPTGAAVGFMRLEGHNRIKTGEIIGAVIILALAGTNLIMNPDQIIPTLVSCLVFPLFEEPLFRGWVWNKISPALPARWNGLLTTGIVTILFAIWHLGYWDVISFHMKPGMTLATMQHIMLMKMVIASILGIFTGLLRWKTGHINASILFHALWNLFGR